MSQRAFVLFFSAAALFFSAAVFPLLASETDWGDVPAVITASGSGSGAAGDYDLLIKADAALAAGSDKEAVRLAARADSAVLKPWQSVILAEVAVNANEPRQVLAYLKTLPPTPNAKVSFGEPFADRLYERALLARLTAKQALGEDTAFERGELATHFFNDSNLNTILGASWASVPLSTTQKIAKMRRLIFYYRFKDVAGLVSSAEIASADLSHDEKCTALFELGRALKGAPGGSASARDAFRKVVSSSCPEDETAGALYWQGVLAMAAKDAPAAESALTTLASRFPNHRLADDALAKLITLNEKTDPSAAEKYERKLLALNSGDMMPENRFEKAFPEYQAGRYRKAAALLEPTLAAEPSDNESSPRAIYWYARSLEREGSGKNKTKAHAAYSDLLERFPYSFYSVLAARRVDKAPKMPVLPRLSGSAPSDDGDALSLVAALVHRGRSDDARCVFALAMLAHPEWEKSHEEFVAQTWITTGHYRKALEMAANHFDTGPYGPTHPSSDPLFAAFYPEAYSRQVARGYASSGLPRGAIEGIMREESLFQATARSPVGATGLMQLMPATARLVGRQIPGGESLTNLTDPGANIMLGSTYLKSMTNKFNGQLPLAIMAYNAGPGNVSKWLNTLPQTDLDEFIENVPFKETRGYVKRVMRSMQVYGGLYREPYFRGNQFFSFRMK